MTKLKYQKPSFKWQHHAFCITAYVIDSCEWQTFTDSFSFITYVNLQSIYLHVFVWIANYFFSHPQFRTLYHSKSLAISSSFAKAIHHILWIQYIIILIYQLYNKDRKYICLFFWTKLVDKHLSNNVLCTCYIPNLFGISSNLQTDC